jgi:hypothetical protein
MTRFAVLAIRRRRIALAGHDDKKVVPACSGLTKLVAFGQTLSHRRCDSLGERSSAPAPRGLLTTADIAIN